MSKPDEPKQPETDLDAETRSPEADAEVTGEASPEPSPADTASLAAPDGATLISPEAADPDDAPVGDPELLRAPSQSEDDATIGDPELMRDPTGNDGGDEAVGATLAVPDSDPASGDHTVADPSLANEKTSSVENDGATQILSEDSATQILPDENAASDGQTMIDNSVGTPGGATSDATIMESVDSPEAPAGVGQTMMESEFHSATGGGSAHDGTQFHDESAGATGRSRPPRVKLEGAHETADRWEYEQRYQLVSNFARGGLGQIWMANDSRLRREVAYKELLPAALKSQNSVERFLEEAQITGQLEHPGIVPIYDIGYQQNGTPFYSMKLVRGDTMEQAIENLHALPKDSPEWSIARRKLLGNFVDICNAIAFAHDKGVLHRDLKPLNVMLGAFGETLVLDWGLAKVLDDEEEATAEDGTPITAGPDAFSVDGETMIETAMTAGSGATGSTGAATTGDATEILPSTGVTAGATAGAATSGGATGGATAGVTAGHSQSMFGDSKRHVRTDVRTAGSQTMMGSVLGTPAYMPPEQAKGKIDDFDPRMDIYSLGGILYKLLTNEQPIQKGKRMSDLLKRVIKGEIIPPREHDAAIEKPLEAVCLKALARKREGRYQSALDLAADVEAFLADEAVTCFEDPPLVKARRWRKKNPRTVAGTAATVTAVVLFLIGSSWVHASHLAEIRAFAAEQEKSAQTAADEGQFEVASAALTEAIGRAGSEPDLADLKASLKSRLALIEQTRIQQLEEESTRRLQVARADFRSGEPGKAQTALAEVLVSIKEESTLAQLNQDAESLLARVETAIKEQQAIEATRQRFEEFRALVDETRARGSMPGSANRREDAQLALATGQQALKLFDLIQDQPLAEPPKWFERDLSWVITFHEDTGKWPLDVLRDEAFELMILQADLETTLSTGGTAEEIEAAATRSLAWLARAEALGISSPVALVWKANCLRMLGNSDDAEAAMTAAGELKPTTVLDFFLLGEEARKAQRFEDALRHYLGVVRLDPGHFWTRHFMGLCYVELGYPHAAVSAFSNAISLRGGNAWPVMLRAVAYWQVKMYEESLADFEAAIALDPGLFNIYVNRGAVYQTMGRYKEALADFQKASQLEPDSPVPHINIAAWHYDRARQIREGEAEFADIDDIARVQQEGAELDAALKAIADAEKAKNAARNPGILALSAKISLRRGDDTVALDLFEKHAKLAPTASDRAGSRKQIGFIHFRLGDFDKALTAFQQADRLVPDDPETVFLLGETYLRLRQAKLALGYYRRFDEMARRELRSEINRPEALYTGIATALNLLQIKDEAIEYYTLAIKQNPDLAAAITKRGWAFATDGLQLAKADFEKAKKLKANADTLIGLGYTLAKLGDWKNAKTELAAGVEQAKKQLQDAEEKQDLETLAQGWGLFFNAATGYAQAFQVARADGSVPGEERQRITGDLYLQTLTQLGEAIKRGAMTGQLARVVYSMENDGELDSFRDQAGFQALLQRAKDALAAQRTSQPPLEDPEGESN